MIELSLGPSRVLFSTRHGGVSDGAYESLNLGFLTADRPEHVIENRRRVAKAAGLAPERLVAGRQVHGAKIREWEGRSCATEGASPEPPAVDGHVTDETGLGLLVVAADCLPVALAFEQRVAMLHCGWRSLAAGIVERALALFAEPPQAAIGPAVGRCCYEVGEEVLHAFRDLDGIARGRMLDLKAIARLKLQAGGVKRIEDVDICTSCREDLFFSHRRDGGVTGRQGGLVWRPSQ